MATKQEIIYDIRERLGIYSDDSDITNEYISYLIDKYRATFLRNKYSNIRMKIPLSNFQKIKLNINPCNSGRYKGSVVKSIETIPTILNFNAIDNKITLSNDRIETYNFNIVDFNRFKHVAQDDPFTRMLIFGSISDDNYLYMKSWDTTLAMIDEAYLNGIFINPEKAWELSPYYDSDLDFDLDFEYPIEGELLVDIVNTIVKDLLIKYDLPIDKTNNATDDTEKNA